MQKNLFIIIAFLFTVHLTVAQDQDYTISAGGVAALPIGTPADFADYGLGFELMYMKHLDKGFKVGGSVGFTQYVADQDLDRKDFRFVPVVAKAMYPIGDLGFGVGLDLGYAIAVNENRDGGFVYEPKATLSTAGMLFTLGYRGTRLDEGTFDAIQLGVSINLN